MQTWSRWLVMVLTVAGLTAAGSHLDLDTTTMAFIYQIAVIVLAMWAGLSVAVSASVLAAAGYNFFFIRPLQTFHIDDPRDWTSLLVFGISAVIVSRIVLAGREQAAEAERRRVEGEASAHIDHLRQSDAFKTSLLRAVSHDLTTPLTTIRIQTASLRRFAMNDAGLIGMVDSIEQETSRLHRRIDNLLTMARLEAGRFIPHPEPTPPADLFRALRESLPSLFSSRRVTIAIDPDCPDLFIDPSLALEILVNLAENAHRAAPGDSSLDLAAGPQGSAVWIEIRDLGPGMPRDSDVARRGLGLEIARQLASASDGSLLLADREGGGTIARLVFPAAALHPSGGLQ